MNKFSAIAVFTLVCLAGCDTAPAPIHTYAKTDPARVVIFNRYPKRPYLTIGRVSCEGPYTPSDSGAARLDLGDQMDFISELRSQAAALGGDAVILKEKDVFDFNDASTNGGNDPGSGRRIRIVGIAIKWTAPAQAEQGPVPAAPAKP